MKTNDHPRRRWGSCRRIGEDSWQLRYPSLTAIGTPGPRRSLVVHGTEKDALKTLAGFERDYRAAQAEFKLLRLERGEDATGSLKNATVNEVWETIYLPKARESLSPLSLSAYQHKYDSYIRQPLGRRRLRTVTHDQVQSILSAPTYSVAKMLKIVLSIIFGEAQNARIIKAGDNVMRDRYKLPPSTRRLRIENREVYRQDEVEEILASCKGQPFEAAVILMSQGGARVAEAAGCRFGDVSFSKDEAGQTWARVKISRNAVLCHGELVVHDTKTPRSRRTIFIPEPHSLRLMEMAKASGGDGWVTDDGCGMPLTSYRLSFQWKSWAERHAARYVPLMYFRDTFATEMHNRGMDPYRISQLLGHTSTSKMLYKHYDRPDDDELQKSFSEAISSKEGKLDAKAKEELMKLISQL